MVAKLTIDKPIEIVGELAGSIEFQVKFSGISDRSSVRVEGRITSPPSPSKPCMIVSPHTAPLDLVFDTHTSFTIP
ncbi:MAG TPA: hypothetical protein V6D09_02760 [Leptolyngbyaceae cyanobacterium]